MVNTGNFEDKQTSEASAADRMKHDIMVQNTESPEEREARRFKASQEVNADADQQAELKRSIDAYRQRRDARFRRQAQRLAMKNRNGGKR